MVWNSNFSTSVSECWNYRRIHPVKTVFNADKTLMAFWIMLMGRWLQFWKKSYREHIEENMLGGVCWWGQAVGIAWCAAAWTNHDWVLHCRILLSVGGTLCCLQVWRRKNWAVEALRGCCSCSCMKVHWSLLASAHQSWAVGLDVPMCCSLLSSLPEPASQDFICSELIWRIVD